MVLVMTEVTEHFEARLREVEERRYRKRAAGTILWVNSSRKQTTGAKTAKTETAVTTEDTRPLDPKVGARRQCLIRQYLPDRSIHPGEADRKALLG